MIRNWEAGDIVTTGQHFAEGQKGVALAITYRLRMFLGEYFLDISQGTPWFQQVLGKVPPGAAEVAVKQRILSTEGVATILGFKFEVDTQRRRIFIEGRILRTDGGEQEFTLSEEII